MTLPKSTFLALNTHYFKYLLFHIYLLFNIKYLLLKYNYFKIKLLFCCLRAGK